jgi:uncharacterized protein (TIGR04141 family)
LPAFTCYRIRSQLPSGEPSVEFDDVVELDADVRYFGPAQGPGFTAHLFMRRAPARVVDWAPFLQAEFDEIRIARSVAPSALLVVEARPPGRGRRRPIVFAFPFGPAGRFMLKSNAFERGYGLRTALNLLYPRGGVAAGRLRAIDSKRRSTTTLRSRFQVSEPSTFETFDDVNRQSDTVYRAVGIPDDTQNWGRRIGGSDSLTLSLDIGLRDIGDLCRRIELAHRQDDYRDNFEWIDYIQPVTDPLLLARLQSVVAERLRTRQIEGLSLAPPEIVDWENVADFRFHFDRRQGVARSPVTHPDLRLVDYLSGLNAIGQLEDLSCDKLRTRHIDVLDGSGNPVYKWQVWRCLVGELSVDDGTFILDEGDFFAVSRDYVETLNQDIGRIPISTVNLPDTTPTQVEGAYNEMAAQAVPDLLLLDRRTVRISSHTTAIEVCDLLSTNRQLIHVKRHFGSSDLSHLFSQGLVSGELLQTSPEFRAQVREKIAESAGLPTFDFFSTAALTPSEFEIVFAIAERWSGRAPEVALPFFSKVNLREVASNLRNRGYRVSLKQIEAVI